jgi:hypothetical protein
MIVVWGRKCLVFKHFRPQTVIMARDRFLPGATPGLLQLAQLEFELETLIGGGHEVELRTYEDLSRYFRDRVRAAAVPLYAAA